MKKILSLSLLLSSALFADHEEGIRYGIGARAGIAAFTGKICYTIIDNRQATTNPTQVPTTIISKVIDTLKPGSISFQGGAFAEVGYRSCGYSFGALVDVYGDTLTAKSNNRIRTSYPTGYSTIEQKCVKAPLHIGVDVRAGRYFGNSLWYGLVGVEAIHMEYTSYYSNGIVLTNANPATAPLYVTFGVPCGYKNCWTSCSTNNNNCNKFWRGALRIGTGIEYNWTDSLNFKLEYRFIGASKKQFNYASPVVAGFVAAAQSNAQSFGSDKLYFCQNIASLMASYQF